MILNSTSLVGQVYDLPGFPAGVFPLSRTTGASHQWIHVHDCRYLAHSHDPAERDSAVTLRACSCIARLQPHSGAAPWAAAVDAAQYYARCSKKVTTLEQASASFAGLADQDVDDALYQGPSLAATVGQALEFSPNSFAIKVRRLRDRVAELRGTNPEAAEALTAALTLIRDAFADLTARSQAAMVNFPAAALWGQISLPFADTDQLVVLSRRCLTHALNAMEDPATILVAVTLSSAQVLAHGPEHAKNADELLALRVPGFVGRMLHRAALWSTPLPDDLRPDVLRSALLVLDQSAQPSVGGGRAPLDAALAAAA